MRETKSASKALWIEKSNSASCKANRFPISASTEAHVVSDCETTSALHRAQLRFSCEPKSKALISTSSEAVVTSLPSAKASVREAKSEAYFGANNEVISLKEKALYSTKAPSAEIAFAVLTSDPTKEKASKAKSRAMPKTIQPIRASIQPSRESVLDRLGPVNIDLQEFLSNKWKSHYEEQVYISLS